MALQKEAAQLANQMGSGYATANAFSNSLMTQTANVGRLGGDDEQPTRGPEISGGERPKTSFVFTVRG